MGIFISIRWFILNLFLILMIFLHFSMNFYDSLFIVHYFLWLYLCIFLDIQWYFFRCFFCIFWIFLTSKIFDVLSKNSCNDFPSFSKFSTIRNYQKVTLTHKKFPSLVTHFSKIIHKVENLRTFQPPKALHDFLIYI